MNCLILFAVLVVQQIQAERIVYHQYMTPEWIMNNAAFIHSTGKLTNNQLRFTDTVPAAYTRLVLVNLISPNLLGVNEDITVKIVVSMDQTVGKTKDSDVLFMISDTGNSVGVFTVDESNLKVGFTGCSGIQGKSDAVLSGISHYSYSASGGPTSISFPAEHTFRFKLQQRWGSCFLPVEGGGYTNTFKYVQKLRQSNGLDLEIYKEDKTDLTALKYVIVTITKEN